MPENFKLPLIATLAFLDMVLAASAAYLNRAHSITDDPRLVSPLAPQAIRKQQEKITPAEKLSNPFNLLLLGLDKRHREQTSYRTDVMMVISIEKDKKRVVLTSIPRDLWVSGNKLNAYFANEGFDKFKERISKITGIEPSRYVAVDFDGAVWAINQLGGVTVNIERSFTDTHYPADRPDAPHPPSFQAGTQQLSGEEALCYCRSRKGNNGEGSDFRRMRRQQNLLVSLPQAFEKSKLFKLSAAALYELLTGELQTNLGVGEVATLLDLFRNWKNYQVEHIVLDTSNFLYHPPMASYGGAYVLRPNGDSFEAIHAFIAKKLNTTTEAVTQ